MSNKRKADYWYSYRKVRSNVQQHLSAIYQRNDLVEMPCSSVNETGNCLPELSESELHQESQLTINENDMSAEIGCQHPSISLNQDKKSTSCDNDTEETFLDNPLYDSDSDIDNELHLT